MSESKAEKHPAVSPHLLHVMVSSVCLGTLLRPPNGVASSCQATLSLRALLPRSRSAQAGFADYDIASFGRERQTKMESEQSLHSTLPLLESRERACAVVLLLMSRQGVARSRFTDSLSFLSSRFALLSRPSVITSIALRLARTASPGATLNFIYLFAYESNRIEPLRAISASSLISLPLFPPLREYSRGWLA
jgi:hypothetical protein